MTRKLTKLITVSNSGTEKTYINFSVVAAVSSFIEEYGLNEHCKYYELDYHIQEAWVDDSKE